MTDVDRGAKAIWAAARQSLELDTGWDHGEFGVNLGDEMKDMYRRMYKAAIAVCNEWMPIEELPDEIKRDSVKILGSRQLGSGEWVHSVIHFNGVYDQWITEPGRWRFEPTHFRLIEGPDND